MDLAGKYEVYTYIYNYIYIIYICIYSVDMMEVERWCIADIYLGVLGMKQRSRWGMVEMVAGDI